MKKMQKEQAQTQFISLIFKEVNTIQEVYNIINYLIADNKKINNDIKSLEDSIYIDLDKYIEQVKTIPNQVLREYKAKQLIRQENKIDDKIEVLKNTIKLNNLCFKYYFQIISNCERNILNRVDDLIFNYVDNMRDLTDLIKLFNYESDFSYRYMFYLNHSSYDKREITLHFNHNYYDLKNSWQCNQAQYIKKSYDSNYNDIFNIDKAVVFGGRNDLDISYLSIDEVKNNYTNLIELSLKQEQEIKAIQNKYNELKKDSLNALNISSFKND